VGDVLVALPSSGVHSNGFSLVRKIIADNSLAYSDTLPETGHQTLGEMLLTPTRIYVKPVLALLKEVDVHGLAHITGGGFDENIPRILKDGQGVEVEEGSWEILPVFRLLEKYGKVPHREMFNIFNMGVGMVMAVAPEDVEKTLAVLSAQGEKPVVIGKVVEGKGVVIK
ncbi:MAG: phosphoribosylformylglycinamidine cyclo-ligase, partial [Muribaculaceae bacterium]|nr:phosphoribosylformylglycinamidine cyclo-ligase [Muribaculaceae bacterium]